MEHRSNNPKYPFCGWKMRIGYKIERALHKPNSRRHHAKLFVKLAAWMYKKLEDFGIFQLII